MTILLLLTLHFLSLIINELITLISVTVYLPGFETNINDFSVVNLINIRLKINVVQAIVNFFFMI